MSSPRRPRRSTKAPGPPRGGGDDEPASAPRIIGGTLRGRRLPFSPDPRTRPMKDRVREALFNLLGPAVEGAIAVDPFAGTGALGFEAISRGAALAFFGERHFPTADALRRSAEALGVTGRVTVCAGDALLWARRMPPIPRQAPWIVFVSPPWSLFTSDREGIAAFLEAFVAAAPPDSRIVVEADGSFDASSLPAAPFWEHRPVPPAMLHLRHLPAT